MALFKLVCWAIIFLTKLEEILEVVNKLTSNCPLTSTSKQQVFFKFNNISCVLQSKLFQVVNKLIQNTDLKTSY